jgi:hypothetical protein
LLDIGYDNGPLQARRLIDRLLDAERGVPVPSAEAAHALTTGTSQRGTTK